MFPKISILLFFQDAEGFAGELKFYEFMNVPQLSTSFNSVDQTPQFFIPIPQSAIRYPHLETANFLWMTPGNSSLL